MKSQFPEIVHLVDLFHCLIGGQKRRGHHASLSVTRRCGGMLLLLLMALPLAQAATLQVGPGRPYAKPSQAIAAAKDGDIILIDAGEYLNDSASWSKNNLTIRGVNGLAHIKSDKPLSANVTAIFEVYGDNTTIENIEFSGASSPASSPTKGRNKAGIKAFYKKLTVRNCSFHGNENGLKSADNPSATGDITIESSEFSKNGYGKEEDGNAYTHNIYIGTATKTFTLQYSYSSDANRGHLVKSRAQVNYILYNRLADSQGDSTKKLGVSSHEINLPYGGVSYIIGNVIRKDALADSDKMIVHGENDAVNPKQELYIVNNTFVDDRPLGVFIRTSKPISKQVIRTYAKYIVVGI